MANTNPHHEELDGCDHGATGKPCRPDPSSNGKDCLEHGNHGGINEDHCLSTTSTSTTTTTLPTITTTTTTTTPTTPTTTPQPPITRTIEAEWPPTTITTTIMGTDCVTPDGYPFVTSLPSCPTADTVVSVPTPGPASRDELAATGVDAGALALVGVAAIIIGRLIRRATR